jgi:hypothetical protein
MIALVLVGIIFLAIPSSDNATKRRNLQNTLSDVQRAARFASQEATLRNTVTRLVFDLETNPVTYTVQYGPAGNLILPEQDKEQDKSLEELKKDKKKNDLIEGQFTEVDEFKDLLREIPPDIQFLGVATSYQKKLMTTDKAAIYFFPSGEKDDALVFLASDDEIGVLEIIAFQDRANINYYSTLNSENDKPGNIQQTKMEEISSVWLKK